MYSISLGAGEALQFRSEYWDAQPPPLHGCLLTAHPVAAAEDVLRVHDAVAADSAGEGAAELRPLSDPGRRGCVPNPMSLARQAEVRLSAHGWGKKFWSEPQVHALDRCFRRHLASAPRCDWDPLPAGQCHGLSHYPPAAASAVTHVRTYCVLRVMWT